MHSSARCSIPDFIHKGLFTKELNRTKNVLVFIKLNQKYCLMLLCGKIADNDYLMPSISCFIACVCWLDKFLLTGIILFLITLMENDYSREHRENLAILHTITVLILLYMQPNKLFRMQKLSIQPKTVVYTMLKNRTRFMGFWCVPELAF